MNKKEFESIIQKIYTDSKKRNFDESIELIVTFKHLNIKNTENRYDYSIKIPHPFLKETKSLVFVKDKQLAEELKGVVNRIVLDDEIKKISKKEAKQLAKENNVFLAEGPAMLTVGKFLGQVLSPRGKMPLIAPPNIEGIKNLIEDAKSRVKVSNKKNKSSIAIQLKIGNKSQKPEDIAENAIMVYNSILEKLPAGKQNIKTVSFKTTMGKPLKVGGEKI
jgi:large subunit ribosomal protein L1